MGFLEERAKKRAENAQKNAGANSIKKDEWLATMSNPDSNIDELGTIVRWIILPLFAIWVWYIGYLFTTKELTGVVEPWQVTLLSFLIPGTIQFLKLYGAKKVLRSFHFKWYDRTAHDFWLWSLVGVVVVLMFAWSLKISIFDVKDTAQENYAASNTDSLGLVLAAATGSIDAQINALNESNQRAGSMKTKKGKIAWSGQSIEMNNSATLSTLNDQKNKIVEQTISDYKAGRVKTEKAAVHRGNFFQRFGGFGEVGEILFCLILGLIEAINRNANIARLGKDQPEHDSTLKSQPVTQQRNGYPIQNNAGERNTIGFKWVGYGQQQTATPPTVSQFNNAVSQQPQAFSVLGCDAVLKQCEKKLRSDLPNFNREDALKSSVSNRINSALNECFEIVQKPEFTPTREVATAFYKFMVETVIPTLNQRGWPYERDTFFLKRILEVIPNRIEA